MASEITADRNRNNQELTNLQDQYQKRRQEIVERNEAQLSKIQSEYDTRKNELEEQGAAAVNHTRKLTAEQVEQIRQNQNERTTYEAKTADQRYQAQRQSGQAKLEGLKKEHEVQQEHLRHQIQLSRDRQGEVSTNENRDTNELIKKHQARRQEIDRVNSQDIETARSATVKAKNEVLANYSKELHQLDEEHRDRLAHIKTEGDHRLKETRKQGTESLNQLRATQGEQYETERTQGSKSIAQLRQAYRAETQRQQADGEQEIRRIHDFNQHQVKEVRDVGQVQIADTNQFYRDEVAKIHKDGDQTRALQAQTEEKKINLQREAYKKEADELFAEKVVEKQKADQTHRAEMERNQTFYRQALEGQRGEFQDSYTKNDRNNIQTLENQRARLVDELDQQKKDTLQHVGKYRNQREDPFYQMQSPKTELKEEAHHYIVETAAPPHERDNIDIRVKGDRVIVSGKRAYNEDMRQDERRVTTNSYQTFREEILLQKPVAEKLVEKTYENGILRARIPKLG